MLEPSTPNNDTSISSRGSEIAEDAGGRIIRGGAVRAVGFVAGILVGLVTSAVLLRYLGVETYGKYGTVAALLGIVLALTDGGLTAIGTRDFSLKKSPAEQAQLGSTLMSLRLVTSTVGVLMAIAFAAVAYSSELTLGAALVGASVILISLQAMATVPLLVGLRIAPITAFEVLRHALTLAGVVVLVLTGAGLTWFFILQIPIAAVLLLMTIVVVRRSIPLALGLDHAHVRQLARATLPLAIASTMIVLYGGAMVIIVSLLTNERDTGLFVTSSRVMEVATGLPGLLIALAMPVLSIASATDPDRLRNAIQLMLRAGLLLSAFIAVTLALCAPAVITLIGGRAFLDAAPILQIQAFAIVGVFASQTLQNALISLHRQKRLIVTNLIALATLLILGVVFVEKFGPIGGAIAIVGAEAIFVVALFVAFRREAKEATPSITFLWKIVVCALLAATAALPHLPSTLLNACLGGVIFGVVAIALRAIPSELLAALLAPIRNLRSVE